MKTPEQRERRRAYMREWRAANPKRCRNHKLKNRYGIEEGVFEALFVAQGKRCGICRSDSPRGKYWHVDHCHDRKLVRGILCHPCNIALGFMGDNFESVKRRGAQMVAYLRKAGT